MWSKAAAACSRWRTGPGCVSWCAHAFSKMMRSTCCEPAAACENKGRGARPGCTGSGLVSRRAQLAARASIAAASGQLSERDAASKALRDLLKPWPDFAVTVREDIEKWWEREYVERLIDGWRKGGLEIALGNATAVTTLEIPACSLLY